MSKSGQCECEATVIFDIRDTGRHKKWWWWPLL